MTQWTLLEGPTLRCTRSCVMFLKNTQSNPTSIQPRAHFHAVHMFHLYVVHLGLDWISLSTLQSTSIYPPPQAQFDTYLTKLYWLLSRAKKLIGWLIICLTRIHDGVDLFGPHKLDHIKNIMVCWLEKFPNKCPWLEVLDKKPYHGWRIRRDPLLSCHAYPFSWGPKRQLG